MKKKTEVILENPPQIVSTDPKVLEKRLDTGEDKELIQIPDGRGGFKKIPFDREEVEKVEQIKLHHILFEMFDYSVFRYKFEKDHYVYLLAEETRFALEEFFKNGYIKSEGNCLMWRGGIRWDKCTEFKKMSIFDNCMKIMERSRAAELAGDEAPKKIEKVACGAF